MLIREAKHAFARSGWALPPNPNWDVTDFGLGDYAEAGLVLVNLAEEPEYCEKLMYAREGMSTPIHSHRVKKEDIICRAGKLEINLSLQPHLVECKIPFYKLNGDRFPIDRSLKVQLTAGERVTLLPGVFHEFHPIDGVCVIGEVSTANDDHSDNVFLDAKVGRFTSIEEDEPPECRLVNELSTGG